MSNDKLTATKQKFPFLFSEERSLPVLLLLENGQHIAASVDYIPPFTDVNFSFEVNSLKEATDLQEAIILAEIQNGLEVYNVRLLSFSNSTLDTKPTLVYYPLSPILDTNTTPMYFRDSRVLKLMPENFKKPYLQSCSSIQLV